MNLVFKKFSQNIIKLFLLISLSMLLGTNSFAEVEAGNIIDTENQADVPKETQDEAITTRLEKIFKATQWYPEIKVETIEGLVILKGSVESFEKKNWAIKLAERTQGVVGVVDKIDQTIADGAFLKPAKKEALKLYSESSKLIPYILSALIIFILFLLLAFVLKKGVNSVLKKRNTNKLLIKTITSLTGLIVFALGFYFALKTSGLSALAVTILGGTGMLGLGLGLALKNIFENYASSIMISVKELLRMGELVSINGHEGVVQSVTTRGTTLMDYDGNNIIIPNTEVFNSVIKNYTRNPNMRLNFVVGIGYDDSIDTATKVIQEELERLSPKVLKEPASIVAVDGLGASTVNLKVYFWIDATQSSSIKLKSVVIKSVKEALMKSQISMPDDAREVVFASPLKIQNLDSEKESSVSKEKERIVGEKGKASEVTKNYDLDDIDLSNEIEDLKKQALMSPNPEKGSNLL